ncbi:hypothetical protein AnigIFM60653_001316 [Aspergillus niger]|nr:hypothetical protein AnigIFM60653_001316 [Aspergillus niger]
MKAFNLLLLWISVLSTHVLADNNAAPYELLYYYYVYKLEWDTGIKKTIAPGCVTKDKEGGMCYFDEFAMYLIELDWQIEYRPKGPVDHTRTPGIGAATKLFINIPTSASYDLEKLLPGIKADEKSFPLVFDTILHSANNAIAQDKVSKDDLEQAVAMAQQAKKARTPPIFALQQASLESRIGADAYRLVQLEGSGFKWLETFDEIDSEVTKGKLTAVAAAKLKETIRQFSLTYEHDILGGDLPTHTHLNIVKALATSITSLTRGIEEKFPSSDDDSSESWPSSECEDEFSYSSSSSSSGSD